MMSEWKELLKNKQKTPTKQTQEKQTKKPQTQA